MSAKCTAAKFDTKAIFYLGFMPETVTSNIHTYIQDSKRCLHPTLLGELFQVL